MCSTPSERLASLRAAIDALAAESGMPDSPAGRTAGRAVAGLEPAAAGDADGPAAASPGETEAGAGQAEDVDARLARLWQMLAQLDPELARRLPRYLT